MANVRNITGVIINVGDLHKSKILTGSNHGQALFRQLLERIPSERVSPAPLFLDFINVDVATASFLRESVLAFRNHVRTRRSLFYPVVANANESIREELWEVCRSGGALMSCTLNKKGEVTETSLIGHLDLKQQTAFDLVTKLREADATQLKKRHPEKEVNHTTAWNNRLASLVSLGLIMELSYGRTKKYRPLFEGI